MTEMSNDQMARLLHAKAAELEAGVKDRFDRSHVRDLDYLMADVALIAGIMSEFIERQESRVVLLEAHSENLIERVYALENGMEDSDD